MLPFISITNRKELELGKVDLLPGHIVLRPDGINIALRDKK
jgi:hypothetical protein